MTLAMISGATSMKPGVCIERMMSARAGIRKLKQENRKNEIKHPGLGQPIDWMYVQKGRANEKPLISFRLKPDSRKAVLRLFKTDRRKLNARQKELKINILQRFRDEFIAVYIRYRQESAKEKGKAYGCMPALRERETKLAELIAVNCFFSGVTPVSVLHYWHKKMCNFANSNIETVPLNMLTSSCTIDEVAINNMSGNRNSVGFDESQEEDWTAPKRKTMWLGDASTLHPRLRRELMGAGFDLSRHNDSDLSTIQDYAMDVKSGEIGIKLIPEALRDMISWALKNTLKDFEPKSFLYKS